MPLSQLNKANIQLGGVTERLNVPVLKTGEGATLPWVRIPPPPPCIRNLTNNNNSLDL